ncbi:MAG: hypothetical protein PHS57_08665 [Alphaproteobacteria bacterium]|nr:hypothetical protein [Alphaproteobacteria bacterium]
MSQKKSLNEATGGSWVAVGSGLTVGGGGTPGICALGDNKVIASESFADDLFLCSFTGSAWNLLSTYASANRNAPVLAGLSSALFAHYDSSTDFLQAFSVSGSTIAAVGSPYTYASTGYQSMCALTDTRIAFLDSGSGKLEVFDWTGSGWTKVGTSYSPGGVTYSSMARLTNDTIALFVAGTDLLRVFRFNGSTWSQVGTTYTSLVIAKNAMAALSENVIVIADAANLLLRCFKWDGNAFSPFGTNTSVASMNASGVSVCRIDENRVALYSYTSNTVQTYQFNPTY